MRLWVPVALLALVVVAYAFFYELDAAESQGSSSLWLTNAAGLAAVFIGIVAAGFLLRRGAQPSETSEPRNP